MIVSWPLWRALRRPPSRNPAFRRAYGAPEQPFPWHIGCLQWLGALLFLPILAVPGTVYGLGWSVGISNLIGRERESGRFEILSLCPSGPLGMSWAIATGYLYHHRTFRNIVSRGNLFFRVLLMALVIGGASALFDTDGPSPFDFSGYLLIAAGIAPALVIDHIQSIIAAALAGMAAGSQMNNRMNAQIGAFALYSGIQLVTWLLTLAIGFSILPTLIALAGLGDFPTTLVLVAGRLLVFAGTRELLLALLWRWLAEQLNPDPIEERLLAGR